MGVVLWRRCAFKSVTSRRYRLRKEVKGNWLREGKLIQGTQKNCTTQPPAGLGERYESLRGTNTSVWRVPHPQRELEHFRLSLSHFWHHVRGPDWVVSHLGLKKVHSVLPIVRERVLNKDSTTSYITARQSYQQVHN